MPTKSKKSSLATSKKKGGMLSRVNFSSRKTQFITVILIVGLMGAGWFTYRSFAASWAYTPENKNLKANVWSSTDPSQICSTATIPDPSKNNAQVILLGCPANHASAYISTSGGYIGSWGLMRQYRICAIVKGSGSSVNMDFWYQGTPTGGKTTTYISNQISSTGYKSVCSPYKAVPYQGSIGGSIQCKRETSCQIAVRSMTIEQL